MNEIIKDIKLRILNNERKVTVLLRKYGIDTVKPTFEDVCKVYLSNPKSDFLSDFYFATTPDLNGNGEEVATAEPAKARRNGGGGTVWTNWMAAAGNAISGFANGFMGQKYYEDDMQLQQQQYQLEQARAEAASRRQSTTLWIVGGVVVLILIVGMFFMFRKK